MNTKRCPACKRMKLRAQFGKRKNGFSRSLCKACEIAKATQWHLKNRDKSRAINRRATLKRNYGITPERYAEMLAAQGGACAVCKLPQRGKRQKHLAVDHCHRTGKLRALLCRGCNRAAGFLEDDPARARALAGYLEAWA